MIKHIQAYTDIEGPVPGDCWRAAVASLISAPDRDVVPHFIHEYTEGTEWWEKTRQYVEEHTEFSLGLYEPVFPVYTEPEGAPPYVILTGLSPRGNWSHAVIVDAVTGELVHDPHPSGAGVLSQLDVAALIPKAEA